MEGKTIEDEEGMRDYSLKQNLRLITHNPDMPNLPVVSCACGELIDRAKDWHVMIANGILLCWGCAYCNCCALESASANRRLVCIDGLVLCHLCLEKFGYFTEHPYNVQVDNFPSQFSHPNNENNVTDFPEALREYKRKDRSYFKPKSDKRRPFRIAYYDPPSDRLSDERNPLLNAPAYDARKGPLEKMVCPACTQVATGLAKYVVPAMARVYHKKCFVCQSCKEPLNDGMMLAGKHFEFCTCEPVQVWCIKSVCRQKRLTHHEKSLCWLGSLRPGGRLQRDTDVGAQQERKLAATKEDKEGATPVEK